MRADSNNVISWQQKLVARTSSREKADDKLRVATYNIMNVNPDVGDPDPSNKDRIDRLAKVMIDDLQSPHILALQEVQDLDGPADTGQTSGEPTLKLLVDAIKAQGGPQYAYTEIAPQDNVDGGQPGANIRTAFLYDPSRVKLHKAPKGEPDKNVELEVKDGKVHLAQNPGRIHPEYHCWHDSRKALVAEFEDMPTGESVFVTNVHLTSKRGGPARDETRAVQAGVIAAFVNEVAEAQKDADPDQNANFIVMGDYNSGPNEAPLQILSGLDHLQNLAKGLDDGSYWTYRHGRSKEAIDHILASPGISVEESATALTHLGEGPRKELPSDHIPVRAELQIERSKAQAKPHAERLADEQKQAQQGPGR